MLFTGDAETQQLFWHIENYENALDVDVLKASHHGSNNGTSRDWLDAVEPRAVIISAGVYASYRHPHEQAVNLL